ncbi:MAG: hypothetical protein LBK99_10310 [Opitutaceae bacterium]|nr:hypothetical protein [Opitutaceae bacterium]
MLAIDIIEQIKALPTGEQQKVHEWLHGQERYETETPEMLAALDAAARSADTRGTTPVSTVAQWLPNWISKSA